MNIQYIGEHLLIGQIGTMFIWLSFISALLIPIAFFMADRNSSAASRKTANGLYIFHFVTLVASAMVLYYALANHYFEYSYVWQYSSRDLPFRFIISCFWAGQEGSFMIWAIWQGLLGLFLLRINTEWRGKVLTVVAFGQVFFLSMVLGLKLGGIQIGSSPFNLLRELPQNFGSDFFNNPNYLSMILDGNGLNPLLENIWMVIHPPTLFLGYAAMMIPFSFAVASLWKRDYYGWLKPALPWALFGVFTLGTGILLGGRWAYESLTFGGFWAWDPVENASLVPWLLLIAALHMMLIAHKRKQSYTMAYVLVFLSFILVIYATYLTRSGVLGETSVHSFGDDGKSAQMLFFMALFTLVPFVMLFMNRKNFVSQTNESLWSREFWMLMGSIVLLLSSFQITVTTSIPVINKILGTSIAPPIENVAYFNNWQTPYGILVAFLIAGGQFLVYGLNDRKRFFKNISIAAVIALFFTIILVLAFHVKRFDHAGLMFFTIFSIVASLDYVFRHARKIANTGAAFTHAGFGIFLLGVILAFSNSQIISENHSGIDLGKEKDNNENLVLMKGSKQPMGDYMVTYSSNEIKGRETFYKVDFVEKADSASGKVAFSIFPSVNHNDRMGNVFNPATRHFFNKDIYTYISFAESADPNSTDGYSLSGVQEVNLKDTITFARSFFILDSIIVDMKGQQVQNASITAKFRVLSMQFGELKTVIKYIIKDGQLSREDGIIEPMNIKLSFQGVSDKSDAIMLGIFEKKSDYIVLKAIVFPWMNVLWAGFVIMLSGLSIAFLKRITDKKNGNGSSKKQ